MIIFIVRALMQNLDFFNYQFQKERILRCGYCMLPLQEMGAN